MRIGSVVTRWRVFLCVLACVGCEPGPRVGSAGSDLLAARRSEVQVLRDSLAVLVAHDPVVRAANAVPGHVAVGVRMPFLTTAVREASLAYLSDVHLHLTPNTVIREGQPVKIRLGPVSIGAGEWRLAVTIERVEVRLRARSVELAAADSNRLVLNLAVDAHEGSGLARIDFEWDAAAVPSVVCRSFEVHEAFEGVVAPRSYDVQGTFGFLAEAGRLTATPDHTGERLHVRPEPTPASWNRLREILARQNNIFRCGLALQPDNMEQMLRDLLRQGFAFRLPESILEPIPLPAAVSETVSLGEHEYALVVEPAELNLTPDALWYSIVIEVGAEPGPPEPIGGDDSSP